MSSGAGDVLVEERREEDGDMYERCLAKEGGGEGLRESSDSSLSDASEEKGTSLKGELGSLFSAQYAMATVCTT